MNNLSSNGFATSEGKLSIIDLALVVGSCCLIGIAAPDGAEWLKEHFRWLVSLIAISTGAFAISRGVVAGSQPERLDLSGYVSLGFGTSEGLMAILGKSLVLVLALLVAVTTPDGFAWLQGEWEWVVGSFVGQSVAYTASRTIRKLPATP